MSALTEAEIDERLAGVREWSRSGPEIVRELSFPDFAAAIGFVNRVAALAEAANHHPDILVHGWNKVRLTLCTHSQSALTEADFRLAGEIDGLL
ncbi:MAG: 4a-hydroxytetrahydrobiopterin dehydratase [Actinomycetota bacterium]|nr:4a-hydroxytetrahydrobiopterin dehydratase [Actinomycetota bacterium]